MWAAPGMFSNISSMKSPQLERTTDYNSSTASLAAAPPPAAGLATILRAFGSSIDDDLPRDPMQEHGSDWSVLIERIRATASRVRQVEAQARERENEVEELLACVRADMRVAEERVRTAELQAAQAEASAAERIRQLEERARLAEDRARTAEAWLKQVHETIFSEFAIPDQGRP